MTSTALAWRLTRAGGWRALLGQALTIAAVVLATAMLLFAVAGNYAFADRAERTTWRQPTPAETDEANAVIAAYPDNVDGRVITRVDLAPIEGVRPPTPPGLAAFPSPGQVWVSPALADLIAELPAEELGDRFGSITGRIGDEALAHPEELVVIVGHAADQPSMSTEAGAVPFADFESGRPAEPYPFYRSLMGIATVLMIVPLLVFGGAAARLTVARRDERLATLRLIGATPGQVVRLTAAEAILAAGVGAIGGALLYAALTPALALIPIDGGAWYVADLLPPPLWAAGILVGVPLMVGVSALIGLRRVVVSPLGVTARRTPPAVKAIRLAGVVVFGGAFMVMVRTTSSTDAVGTTVILVLLGATFLAINAAGPWIVRLIGVILAKGARRASTMLAGRRLLDDPKAAWRTVAGISLTGFVAGFIAMLAPVTSVEPGATTTVTVLTVTEDPEAVADDIAAVLPGTAAVAGVETEGYGPNAAAIVVAVDGDASEIDAVRTLLTDWSAAGPPWASDDMATVETQVYTDIRVGVTVVLGVSILIAMVSAAISGASSVLDRRRTYALLHLSGTPRSVLDRARLAETTWPLAVMGGGSIATGLILGLPLTKGVNTLGLTTLAVTVVLGAVGVVMASAASRPLLVSAMENASPRPD